MMSTLIPSGPIEIFGFKSLIETTVSIPGGVHCQKGFQAKDTLLNRFTLHLCELERLPDFGGKHSRWRSARGLKLFE